MKRQMKCKLITTVLSIVMAVSLVAPVVQANAMETDTIQTNIKKRGATPDLVITSAKKIKKGNS